MRKQYRHLQLTVFALLALFLAAPGCTDLDVTNPNDPGRDRALATAGDVESLVAGSFHTWYNTWQGFDEHFFVSAASFQHSCTPANFGCVEYSGFPRGQIVNSTSDGFYGNISGSWGGLYSALASVRDGLGAINANEDIADQLNEDNPQAVTRLQAYGKFVQGLSHAGIALLYDQGFVVDETQEEGEDPELLGYQDLMQRAMGYFDEAISLAQGADFTIPEGWMSQPVDSETLVRLAHTMKARYMAGVARDPAERQAVDWNAVLSELEAGLDETWYIEGVENMYDTGDWAAIQQGYYYFPGWAQMAYFIHGMADQSGNYQAWLDQPLSDRGPDPGGEPFLIQTPDTRYPEGTTLADQIANPGDYMSIPHPTDAPCASASFTVDGEHFERESRGVWRWSYYYDHDIAGCQYEKLNTRWALAMIEESRLLEAEAHLNLGQAGMAADLINETRTEHGLNATDASGANTSCVPRLPDGSCGDLMEMLKWEKRLESRYRGVHSNGWFYDGRGWGDLYSGTYLHLPIPEEDLLLLDMTTYTTGPGAKQGSAASTSVYNWPEEG